MSRFVKADERDARMDPARGSATSQRIRRKLWSNACACALFMWRRAPDSLL